MDIIAASSNHHKIREFTLILAPLGLRVIALSAVAGAIPIVEESGATFAENAIIKAREYARAIGKPVFADDSGIEVMALGGKPGIHSARYAGINANDGQNVDKLMSELAPFTDRSARFVCVIAVATPDALIGMAEGEVRGSVALSARGHNGFGYDPVFIPEGWSQTMAELDSPQKHTLSHRGRALRQAVQSGLFKDLDCRQSNFHAQELHSRC